MENPGLHTQEGMERSLREFVRYCREDLVGSMCQKLELVFVECSFEEKSVTMCFEPAPWMANPAGVMHGGVVAAFIDEVTGSLTFYMNDENMTPTIDLDISYIRPVLLDKTIYVKAKCQSSGKTMAYTTAEMWNEGGKTAITAKGIYSTKFKWPATSG